MGGIIRETSRSRYALQQRQAAPPRARECGSRATTRREQSLGVLSLPLFGLCKCRRLAARCHGHEQWQGDHLQHTRQHKDRTCCDGHAS